MTKRPARRLSRRTPKNKGSVLKLLFYLILLIGLILTIAFIFLAPSKLDKNSKLIISVYHRGDIQILFLDTRNRKITKLFIPEDAEVDAARSLGTWRLKSIWQLGFNEGYKGRLLSETVSKNFKIATFVWSDTQALGFASGNVIKILKAGFLPYKTNLTIVDKLKIAIFSLGVKEADIQEVNLTETVMLSKIKLKDGDYGYRVSSFLPNKLLLEASFVDLIGPEARVAIYDASEKYGLAKEIGGVVEALGAKITNVATLPAGDGDCEVKAKNRKLGKLLANIFSCKLIKDSSESGFDASITLGKAFAGRY